jgi:hypothetical protein
VTDSKTSLDFIIIGAPKAGTTSLHEYLKTHPEVHLPSWKETNFFLDPRYQRGVDWYLDWVLGEAGGERVRGEASVRYMAGTPWLVSDEEAARENLPAEYAAAGTERVIPERIHAALPDVKLIALLRDPVKRCISEYGMAVLREIEHRSPDEALETLLQPEQLEKARAYFTDTTCYVAQSEYGRVLKPFFEIFPREQLLVLFTSDLAERPREVVQQACAFLGVDDDFVPPNLGVRYLEGATRPRVRYLDFPRFSRALRQHEGLRSAWRRLPSGFRRRAWSSTYKIEKWNRVTDTAKKSTEVSPELEAKLREHFQADRELIAELVGTEPPWR